MEKAPGIGSGPFSLRRGGCSLTPKAMDILIDTLKPALVAEAAALWHEGWIDGHAAVVPEELRKLRTLESFRLRIQKNLPICRAAMEGDTLLGFTMVKGDELYQMYAASSARGRGVAQVLIQDAEQRMRASGTVTAWLSCAVGNNRAARFYEKSGWVNRGEETVALETLGAPFLLSVWRFEKQLKP